MTGTGDYKSWCNTLRVPALGELQNNLGKLQDGNPAQLVPPQDFYRRVTLRNVSGGALVIACAFEVGPLRANAIQSDVILVPDTLSDVFILSPGQGLWARITTNTAGRVTYAVSEALPIKQE